MQNFIDFYEKNFSHILAWIDDKYSIAEDKKRQVAFTSVDIRNAGFKTAHVDSNLFPGGFAQVSDPQVDSMAAIISRNFKDSHNKKIFVYPEQFSRNKQYISNLMSLQAILQRAGLEPMFVLSDEIFSDFPIDNKIRSDELKSDESSILLLNNDLTDGIPQFITEFQGIIIPDPALGWHGRRKSNHFAEYNQIIKKLAAQFNFDPWLLSTYTGKCTNIDFRERKNLECIALAADKALHYIQQKYDQYAIKSQQPYVYIKADNGTFGMGIMKIFAGEEIFSINKKQRHSMQKIKLGLANNQILIQEGVPTIERHQDSVSESMVYSTCLEPVAIFERSNSMKDSLSNLNSHGMEFSHSQALPRDNIKYLIAYIANIANHFESYFFQDKI